MRTVNVERAAFLVFAIVVTSCSAEPDDNAGAGGSAGSAGGTSGSSAGAAGSFGGAAGSMGGQAGSAAGAGGGLGGTAGDPGQGGAGAVNAGSGGSGGSAGGSLPPVDSVDGNGPFPPKTEGNLGPGGKATLIYPTDLGKDGIKHPIVLWDNGAGVMGPSSYVDLLQRIASHGFVVYAAYESSNAGTELSQGLDWIIQQNTQQGSSFYQKLDTSKIASMGHSRGSLATFAIGGDARLTTTLHLAGGSFDGMGPSMLKKPTAYICGETDLALANCQRDYANTTTLPVYFADLQGVDHVSVPRRAISGIIAWLRWHLAGEAQRKSMFIGSGCTYCTGIWRAQSKNW